MGPPRRGYEKAGNSLFDSDRDRLVAGLDGAVVPVGAGWRLAPGRAVRRRSHRRPVDVSDVIDNGADHVEQCEAVIRDDGEQRMLFAGGQRRQRAHRAPHLLALAGPGPDRRRQPPVRPPSAPRGRSRRGSSRRAGAARGPVWDLDRDESHSRRPHLRVWSETNCQLTGAQMRVQHRAAPQYGRQPNPAPQPAGADDQVVVDPAQRQRSGIKLGQR